jgi:hypothetical protein
VEKEMNRLEIPETDSIEELARFWDTRDLTDFEDQLEIVAEPVFERLTETILVRMPRDQSSQTNCQIKRH